MKVLCLHGFGTSGSIMERQFAPFCGALDAAYEFTYVDGELEVARPKELMEMIPGPFLAYWKNITPESVQEALDLVAAVIEEEGPFEGLIAFSHGGAVAMSYLLNLEMSGKADPPPFKWAVFFSPAVPLSPDPQHLERELAKHEKLFDKDDFSMDLSLDFDEVSTEKTKKVPKHRVGLVLDRNKRALVQEITEISRAILAVGAEYNIDTSAITAKIKEGSHTIADLPRIYHPLLTKKRISIPTVVVVGKKEKAFLFKQTALARKLCAADHCTYIEHSGGHDIPRHPAELAKVIAAVNTNINKSQLMPSRWPRF